MKGSETKLVSYMQGSDKRFVIPVYQRNYDWKTENCKQLYDDLIKVIRRGRKSHFFGSIVSVHNDGEFNEYLVIDFPNGEELFPIGQYTTRGFSQS